MLSVTEGEDKPLKYPGLFNTCDVVLLTKMDLAEACEFDLSSAVTNLQTVRPGIEVFETSGKTLAGLDPWINWLEARRKVILG
jgi:hydrogenase nickel incorporation protein HypB